MNYELLFRILVTIAILGFVVFMVLGCLAKVEFKDDDDD